MHSPEEAPSIPGLHACNHTELYQLCVRTGVTAHPAMPREMLMALLVAPGPGAIEHGNPLDSWRHGLAGFVLDHWKTLQNQVTCPMRSGHPRECFGCLDTQVVTCLIKNPTNEPHISKHRK